MWGNIVWKICTKKQVKMNKICTKKQVENKGDVPMPSKELKEENKNERGAVKWQNYNQLSIFCRIQP